jgi:hypothetical protein
MEIERRSCFDCCKITDCEILKALSDENGDLPVTLLENYGNVCSYFFNPKLQIKNGK